MSADDICTVMLCATVCSVIVGGWGLILWDSR